MPNCKKAEHTLIRESKCISKVCITRTCFEMMMFRIFFQKSIKDITSFLFIQDKNMNHSRYHFYFMNITCYDKSTSHTRGDLKLCFLYCCFRIRYKLCRFVNDISDIVLEWCQFLMYDCFWKRHKRNIINIKAYILRK